MWTASSGSIGSSSSMGRKHRIDWNEHCRKGTHNVHHHDYCSFTKNDSEKLIEYLYFQFCI